VQPEPQAPPAREPDDNALGTTASIALVGIVVLLIAAVGVAISREGRKLRTRAGRKRRGRRAGRPAQPRKGGAATGRARTPAGARRDGGKAPPPPPRKRRPKAKRR
jgi:hypothetical protein